MKYIFLFFITIATLIPLQAQNPIWTNGTAMTVPWKNAEISALRPARYGLTRHSELSMHPAGTFMLPHLFFKKEWMTFKFHKKKHLFSSRHGLYYPTFAERFSAKHRLLNAYMPSDNFSPALGFQNEILISRWLDPPSHCYAGNNLLTLKIGTKYSFGSGKPHSPPANRPILYRESRVFEPKLVSYIGIGIDAHLNNTFNYFADLDFYNIGLLDDFTVEGKAGIMGYSGRHWSSFIGVKGGFTTMDGQNRLFIFPIGDIAYTFRTGGKRKNEMGLFGTEMFKYQSMDETGEENIRYRNEDRSGIENPDSDSEGDETEPGKNTAVKKKRKWLPWKK